MKYFCSNVSKPGGSAGVGGAGSLFAVSDNNNWTNFSNGDTSGALTGGGTVGVRTSNNFFNSSSLLSTGLFGLFTVTTHTSSIS